MFHVMLNPIRASVDVILETLSDAELEHNRRAKDIMDSYRNEKSSLARQAGFAGSVEDLLRM
jgi:cupin superfamily acireductone dioxygenase involved in methionine salvage